MARRNDHSREELTELTLSTVEKFLETRSFHDLSLRKIAGLIGYVPSTLINVFGNYNLLLLHVVARTVDKLASQARERLSTLSDPKEQLRELAYCYLDFAAKNPYRWQLVFEHNMKGERLPQWQSDRIDSMTGMLEGLLKVLSPNRSQQEVTEASRVLWAGVHGITLLSVDDKLFTDVPVNGKNLIDNLLNSYLPAWIQD